MEKSTLHSMMMAATMIMMLIILCYREINIIRLLGLSLDVFDNKVRTEFPREKKKINFDSLNIKDGQKKGYNTLSIYDTLRLYYLHPPGHQIHPDDLDDHWSSARASFEIPRVIQMTRMTASHRSKQGCRSLDVCFLYLSMILNHDS
ncbi:hypothetical protein L484_020502 [Morus notabilis]|uniref:Uncharacterized protein n=1 Tax=Morus notabilis TaxID=981085 RepID=W9S0N0_9ROSA|nr:hypothetical protein L484_020502 [Morus notabilis]